jgi:prepilin-type processing-associated H-X9-DG protein
MGMYNSDYMVFPSIIEYTGTHNIWTNNGCTGIHWDNFILPYFNDNTTMFECPSDSFDKQYYSSYGPVRSYAMNYFLDSGRQVRLKTPSKTLLVSEYRAHNIGNHWGILLRDHNANCLFGESNKIRLDHNSGLNVLFCDNHVEWKKSNILISGCAGGYIGNYTVFIPGVWRWGENNPREMATPSSWWW